MSNDISKPVTAPSAAENEDDWEDAERDIDTERVLELAEKNNVLLL